VVVGSGAVWCGGEAAES